MGTVKSGRYILLCGGVRRNRLTFLREAGKNQHGEYLVQCQCACGTKVIIRKSEFRETGTKSCGCAQKEVAATLGKTKRHSFGASNRRTVYSRYRRFAIQRGLVFELTLVEFAEITAKPCHYCGSLPCNKEAAPKHYGEFVYNGIDRVDNSLGYVLSNTVPCCIQCNKAKGTLTESEFQEWVGRVFKHLYDR